MSLYTEGKWMGGVGWMSARPVAKITRKRKDRHGDEVIRGTRKFPNSKLAREFAEEWAERKNAEELTEQNVSDTVRSMTSLTWQSTGERATATYVDGEDAFAVTVIPEFSECGTYVDRYLVALIGTVKGEDVMKREYTSHLGPGSGILPSAVNLYTEGASLGSLKNIVFCMAGVNL